MHSNNYSGGFLFLHSSFPAFPSLVSIESLGDFLKKPHDPMLSVQFPRCHEPISHRRGAFKGVFSVQRPCPSLAEGRERGRGYGTTRGRSVRSPAHPLRDVGCTLQVAW